MYYVSGDLSSISGSESNSDSSEECYLQKTTPTDSSHHSPFIYFTSGDSEAVYSVYRVALTGEKVSMNVSVSVHMLSSLAQEYASTEGLVPSLLSLSHPPLWMVLMHGGGHFAGAVFSG